MGKKSKKIYKTQESHLQISDEGKLELENGNYPSETNDSTHSVKKSKKKRKQDLNGTLEEDIPAQMNSEIINESKTPADSEIKKEKRKKKVLNNEVPSKEVQNYTYDNLNEDELHIPKKKKKKNKISAEHVKLEKDEVPEIQDHKPQKDSKKNKNSSVNEVKNERGIVPKIEKKETKKKNKAKTGAPALKDEEAQVTEEDIDKFIDDDELDDEDNKQYEDWVKLLDARLSKKTKAE